MVQLATLADSQALQPFYFLEATDHLPAQLKRELPRIVWIPADHLLKHDIESQDVVLWGRPVVQRQRKPVPLLSFAHGTPSLHFNIGKTIQEILLERYHEGLRPTMEMRLPFNYSRLPNFVKGVGRTLRQGKSLREPKVSFPSSSAGTMDFVVDWLRQLSAWIDEPIDDRFLIRSWPPGYQAAVMITHDVDTDWLFKNPKWLERICDIEETYGLRGAWYCVPAYCDKPHSYRGMERLRERGCELGCHGFNHDAKWPLLGEAKFNARADAVRNFAERWQMRGFRSEWLWRTPRFMIMLSEIFDYDSSVPSVSSSFTKVTRNGCGTCFPYLNYGNLVELPLTLPMDVDRFLEGLDATTFWQHQVERAESIIAKGGLVVLSLHPQSHQAANEETMDAVEMALKRLSRIPNLWLAPPYKIVNWIKRRVI